MLLSVATVTLLVHQIRHFFTSPQEKSWNNPGLSISAFSCTTFFESSFLMALLYNEHTGMQVPTEAGKGHLIY